MRYASHSSEWSCSSFSLNPCVCEWVRDSDLPEEYLDRLPFLLMKLHPIQILHRPDINTLLKASTVHDLVFVEGKH